MDIGSQSGLATTFIDSSTLEVLVGPQLPSAAAVSVTLATSEVANSPVPFDFLPPTITSLSPASGSASATTVVQIYGTNFVPSATVVFGSQSPAVTFVDITQLTVTVGPQTLGPATVTVTVPTTEMAAAPVDF